MTAGSGIELGRSGCCVLMLAVSSARVVVQVQTLGLYLYLAIHRRAIDRTDLMIREQVAEQSCRVADTEDE